MNEIPYGRHSVTEEDINKVVDILKSKFLTQGPVVAELEDKFCQFLDVKFAVAVNNGTAALHLGALALGVGPGDKVITTSNSFVATANAAKYCGAEVVLCDIDPRTKNLCLDHLQKTLEELPKGSVKAVFPVSFAGHPFPLTKLKKISSKYGFKILEDACHALGGEYKDEEQLWHFSGSCHHSDIAVFSLHPVKHIAAGEGGIITTNNEVIFKKMLKLRSHGIEYSKDSFTTIEPLPWTYEMQELGYNYRMSELNAGLASSQFNRLKENISNRREIAKRYLTELKNIDGLILPTQSDFSKHAYHLFVIQTTKRNELYAFLKNEQIHPQIHYIPIHYQPYYKQIKEVHLPNCEAYYDNCLSIPMFHTMSSNEQSKVINTIRDFFNRQ